MSEEQTSTEQQNEVPAVDTQQDGVRHAESQSADPRRRLRELLAVPERDRSDAVWDEIIALEIDMAPANRVQSPQAEGARRQDPGRRQQSGRRPDQARRQEPALQAKPSKRFFQKRKRGPGAPPER